MKETTHQVNASAQTTGKMSLSQMIETEPSIDSHVSQRSNSISSPQRLSKQEKNRIAQRNHVQQQKAYLEDLEAKIQELNLLLPAEARMAQPSSPSNRERTQSPVSPSMAGNSSTSLVGMLGKRHGNTKTVEMSGLEDLPLHERRMIQNRISQRTSRLRKKKRIADLELHVRQLQQKVNQLGLVPLTDDPVPVPCPVGRPSPAATAAEAPTLVVSIPSSDDVDKQLPSLRSIFPGLFASLSLPNGNRSRAQTM
ncbi:hypothetical protein HDU78_000945 [Chytriomyces hyalinus]|nr:hypothetical protein HDU78_000945 [Chytriomyces hyalinus]